MELMIAAGKAVPKLQLEYGLAVDRVYTGSFMTSLDMAGDCFCCVYVESLILCCALILLPFSGFSISIMKADQSILERLDAPTNAPSWPVGTDGSRPPAKIPVPLPFRSTKNEESRYRPQELSQQGRILEAAIEAAATVVINLKDSLNEWDGKVGDGDCGSTMCRGATAILEDMKKYYPLNDAAETVSEIGSSIRRVMGGTSGIIYNLLCKAAYAELKANSQSETTSKHWSEALKSSISAVSKYGGATAGYRTMLDALIPASKVLEEKLSVGEDPIAAFVLSAEAATAGAESTIHMKAQVSFNDY
jgi:dihydroxyacetone kinase